MRKAKDFRAMARGALKGKWGVSILVCFVASLLGGIVTGGSSGGSAAGGATAGSGSAGAANGLDLNALMEELGANEAIFAAVSAVIVALLVLFLCLALIQLVIGGAVHQGLNVYNVSLIKGETPAFSTLFCRFNNFGRAFGLRLVSSIFIALWTLLLVVPGIIKSYAYSLAPYIMAENPDIGIMEALKKSQELMKGNKWRLFCLELSFIGWDFLNLFTLGIGTLWLNPYKQAAYAGFYLETSKQIV